MTDLKTRYVGNCPVCAGDFRLHRGRMVHHGYKRPGVGYIYGDCYGVGYPPYETSTEGCEAYGAAMVERGEALSKYSARLENGEIRKLSVERRFGPGGFEDLSADDEDPAKRARFARALENEISQTKASRRFADAEVERMVARTADWRERPVRTFDEVAQVADQEKGTRRAEREAKHAERQAKRDRLDAKRAEREGEKQALMDKYRALFRGLASEGVYRSSRALGAWEQMHKDADKKAYLHFYPRALGIDDALVELGLAKREGGRIWYASQWGRL